MQTLLFDQYDYMKRLRANGGAPDTLKREGIAILIGQFKKTRRLAAELGFPSLKGDEIVAVAPHSEQEADLMRANGVITTDRWTN